MHNSEHTPNRPLMLIFRTEYFSAMRSILRVCYSQNAQLIVEWPLHPEKVHFGKRSRNNHYGQFWALCTHVIRLLWERHRDYNLEGMSFQQNGATSQQHIGQSSSAARAIARTCNFEIEVVNWPARSCVLMPLAFFLWGYVKDPVYAHNAVSLTQQKANIRDAIAEILPEMCRKVIENK